MSVRFDANTDRLRISSAPAMGNMTMMMWVWKSVDIADHEFGAGIYDTGAGAGTVWFITETADRYRFWDWATTGYTSSGPAPVIAEWRRIALAYDTTNGYSLYEGDADPTAAVAELATAVADGSHTPSFVAMPAWDYYNGLYGLTGYFNGRVANWKIYTERLSLARIKEELAYFNPQSSTNLWAAWPLKLHTDLNDISGNARHLASVGSTACTTEADPPITDDPSGGTASTVPLRDSRHQYQHILVR